MQNFHRIVVVVFGILLAGSTNAKPLKLAETLDVIGSDVLGTSLGECYISDLASSFDGAKQWAREREGYIKLISIGEYPSKIVFTYYDGLLQANTIRSFYKDMVTCKSERKEPQAKSTETPLQSTNENELNIKPKLTTKDFLTESMIEEGNKNINWTLIDKDKFANVHLNTKVNKKENGFSVAWIRITHILPVPATDYNVYAGVKVKHYLERDLIDCVNNKFATTNSAVYRPNGKLLKSWIFPKSIESFSDIVNDSIEAKAAIIICKYN